MAKYAAPNNQTANKSDVMEVIDNGGKVIAYPALMRPWRRAPKCRLKYFKICRYLWQRRLRKDPTTQDMINIPSKWKFFEIPSGRWMGKPLLSIIKQIPQTEAFAKLRMRTPRVPPKYKAFIIFITKLQLKKGSGFHRILLDAPKKIKLWWGNPW